MLNLESIMTRQALVPIIIVGAAKFHVSCNYITQSHLRNPQ